MLPLESIQARPILNSRGDATIEVILRSGKFEGIASAPGGASTGAHEVPAFPEGGFEQAMKLFRLEVAPLLKGKDAEQQSDIDWNLHQIDGTDNFSRIGGAVSTATSIANAKLASASQGIPLHLYLTPRMPSNMPSPLANLIGGGKHALGGTDIQEFLSLAVSDDVWDAIHANAKAFKAVGEKLHDRFQSTALGRGDEGAWVASISNTDALEMLCSTCDEISDLYGVQCRPGLDIAASSFFDGDGYRYREGGKSREEQISFVLDIVDRFEVAVVEDPLQEDDFEGFAEITRQVGGKCLIVGDDLYATRIDRLKKGVEKKATNAILIKPNQVGTLSDTRATVDLARKKRITTIVSHRSGETTDPAIAHLAVAFESYAIKAGAVGGERVAKLNELVRIQDRMGAG